MTSIETLRAVLHPTRRRMYYYLHLHGPCQVGTLAVELGEQVGSISHHLRMLARVGVVEQVPELATDGRTSWWQVSQESFSWAADDFADSPADHLAAKAAERMNFEFHAAQWAEFKRLEPAVSQDWRRAAFAHDFVAKATPEEVAELGEALARTWRAWRDAIDLDDDQERKPILIFAHGFPSAL